MTSSPDRPERHFLTETAAQGPWGGPVYSYRGAEIRCAKGGHVCSLFMDGHPLHGGSFGVVGTITPLIDLWVEERRLPSHMRVVVYRAVQIQATGAEETPATGAAVGRCSFPPKSQILRALTARPAFALSAL